MTQLFAVVGAVYASDCLRWAPRSSLGLRALRTSGFRRAWPSTLLGNADAGWVWANPLPPLGTLLFSAAWPVAASPDGIATTEALEFEASARRAFRARALRWSDIERVESVERVLHVNDEPFATCDSARLARELADQLDAWRELNAAERALSIESALAAAFDQAQVLTRVEHHLQATSRLRWLCLALFAWLALVSPAALLVLGGGIAWPIVLTGLLALHVAVCSSLARTFRARFPDCVDERRRALLAIALSPTGAVRAVDELARPLLADLHPVAAAVLLPQAERVEVVRATLAQLRNPRIVDDPDALALDVQRWFGERLEQRLRSTAARLEVDVDALLAPPAAESDDSIAFCPRCRRQFTRDDGLCFDCTVRLAPLRA